MENLGLYLLVLVIPLFAQGYVTSTYSKYKRIMTRGKLTGYDVARKILDENGLKEMYIVETKGMMSDHYDSSRKIIRLSSEVYKGTSIAANAIAAHECGHAIQDKEGYAFMKVRSFIFPIVNLGTKLAYIILFVGLILSSLGLIYLAIAFVSLGLLFQLITLPVEFNASTRAKKELTKYSLVNNEERDMAEKMLKAAALTYVAGVLASALEILRYILMFTNRD